MTLFKNKPQKIKRQATIVGEVVYIPLTKGKVAIIDRCDLEKVQTSNWCAQPCGASWRATRRKNHRLEYMHRVIMSPSSDCEVDHKNGNGLDNRRANLRICAHAQNMKNSRQRKPNSRPFKGVAQRSKNSWAATIWHDYTAYYLGSFRTPTDAAIAYNRAAEKLHGEFAALNEV